MKNERPEYLRLIPVGVKAVKTSVDGRDYEIYENNPYLKEHGTLVPTDDAIEMMVRTPNLITGAYTIEHGEAVSAIPEDIVLEIKRKQAESIALTGTHEAPKKREIPTSDDSVLKELVKSQATLIENQSAQMTALMEQMKEMQKQMSEISKKR